MLYEFETEDSLSSIRNAMKRTYCDYQIVPFLMSCELYDDTYQELTDKGDYFSVSLVKCIRNDSIRTNFAINVMNLFIKVTMSSYFAIAFSIIVLESQ